MKTPYPKFSQLERNFQCGYGARKNGYSINSCPYRENSGLSWFEDERQAWLNGWIKADNSWVIKLREFFKL